MGIAQNYKPGHGPGRLERSANLPLSHRITDGVDDWLAVSALEMSCYMRNQLLRDADWAGMAHSLEIRVPLSRH